MSLAYLSPLKFVSWRTQVLPRIFALLMVLSVSSVQAGVLKSLFWGVTVASLAADAHRSTRESPPKVKERPYAPSEFPEEHMLALSRAPTENDLRSLPAAYQSSQCGLATLWTILGTGHREGQSYSAFADDMLKHNVFTPEGTNIGVSVPGFQIALDHYGYTSEYVNARGDNQALTRRIASTLDEGGLVLVATDALSAYRAETGKDPSISTKELWVNEALGSRHAIRITAVKRDTQGQVAAYGVYDVNVPGGSQLTEPELRKLLDTNTLKTYVSKGVILATRADKVPAGTPAPSFAP